MSSQSEKTAFLVVIVIKDPTWTRVCVHVGPHKHLVAKGQCRDALIQIRNEIMNQVSKTLIVKPSVIGIAVGKELLMKGLIDDSDNGNFLSESKLGLIFEKWSKLNESCMNNMINDAKISLNVGGYIDNILKLKNDSKHDYIHDSCFPS